MSNENVGRTVCPHCQKPEWYIYQLLQGQLRVAICISCAKKYGIEDAYKFIV